MKWEDIKKDYCNTDMTLKQLGEKYNIRPSLISYHAKKDVWIKKRDPKYSMERVIAIADNLLGKIEQAIDELDMYALKKKYKIKKIEYLEENGKIEKEVIEEKEKLENIRGIIDKDELKTLCIMLKELKAIYTDKDDDDESGSLELLLKGLKNEEIQ